MKLKLGEKEYELSTSLRVVYSLKELTGARNLQEAMSSISHLDLDGQMRLLYSAYKAGSGKHGMIISQEAFTDAVLDNLGVFALTEVVNKLTDGLLYSGLSPEEIESKKAQAEKAMVEAGVASSATDTD